MINSSISQRCGCKRPILKTASILLAFIFLFIFSYSVIGFSDYGNMISWDEYQASGASGSTQGYLGFLNTPYLDGGFYPSSDASTLAVNPNAYRGSVIGNINPNNHNVAYMAYTDADSNLIVKSLIGGQLKNSVIYSVTPPTTYTPYQRQPRIVKFANDIPYIVVADTFGGGAYNYWRYENTTLTRMCGIPNTAGPNMIFDSDLDMIITTEFNPATPNAIILKAYGSDCSLTASNTITFPSDCYTSDAVVKDEGHKELVIDSVTYASIGNGSIHRLFGTCLDSSGHTGMYVVNYNRTHFIGLDSMFDGDGSVTPYSCQDGFCTDISASYKIGLIFDEYSSNLLMAYHIAGVYGSNYQLRAIDQLGNELWRNDGFNYCGNTNQQYDNFTFFVPSMWDTGKTDNPKWLCGACQPSCDGGYGANCNNIYVKCVPTDTGGSGSGGGVSYWETVLLETNHYGGYTSNWGQYIPQLQNIITAQMDKRSDSLEILVRDHILNPYEDREIKHLNFYDDVAIVNSNYGWLSNYTENFVYDDIIALYTNSSSRIFHFYSINTVPQFTAMDFSVDPTVKVCLNFSRDTGISTSWLGHDNESDNQITKYYCDTTYQDATFYNWTDWHPAAAGGYPNDFNCRYNKTGLVTIKVHLTDAPHLYNLTFAEAVPRSTTFTLVDNIYPNCQDTPGLVPYCASHPLDPSCISIQPPKPGGNNSITSNLPTDLCTYYGVCTVAERTVFGLVIIAIITIALVLFGIMLSAQFHFEFSTAYITGIMVIDVLAFLIMTGLGIFPIYFLLLVLLVVAIIGGSVWLKVTGNYNNSGGD